MGLAGRLAVVGVALSSFGCCGERPFIVCPMPIAMVIEVVDAGGGPVPGMVVQVSGPLLETSCRPGSAPGFCEAPCKDGTCYVWGHSGTYVVDVDAPGFQSTQFTASARDKDQRCPWCEILDTASLRIVLIRA